MGGLSSSSRLGSNGGLLGPTTLGLSDAIKIEALDLRVSFISPALHPAVALEQSYLNSSAHFIYKVFF